MRWTIFFFIWSLLVCSPPNLKPTSRHCVEGRREYQEETLAGRNLPTRLKGRDSPDPQGEWRDSPISFLFSIFSFLKISLCGDGILDSGSNRSQQEPRTAMENFPLWLGKCPISISYVNKTMKHMYTQSPSWIRSAFLSVWGKPLRRVAKSMWLGDRKFQVSGRMSKSGAPDTQKILEESEKD